MQGGIRINVAHSLLGSTSAGSWTDAVYNVLSPPFLHASPLPLRPSTFPPLSPLFTCQLVVLSAAQQKEYQVRMGNEDKAGVIPEDRGDGGGMLQVHMHGG